MNPPIDVSLGSASSVCCMTSKRPRTSARAQCGSFAAASVTWRSRMWIGRNVEWITHDLAVDDHYRVDVEKVENRRPIELSGVVLAKHGQWMGFQYFVDPPFEFGQVFRIRTGNAMQRPCHFGCHARPPPAGRVKATHVTKTVEHRVRVKSPTRTNCLHGGRHEEVI